MIIRKLFKFESTHIVRNCSSERCRKSIHGHGYKVEVFFESDKLDNGGMLMDFGLMKSTIKDFIDSFDHCWQYWDKEDNSFIDFIKTNSDRWVSMPISPSAEQYSLMFLYVIDKILNATEFNNGEGAVKVSSVRVHETDTGYAESFRKDLDWVTYRLEDIVFSSHVKAEWEDPEMYNKVIQFNQRPMNKPFKNKIVDQQII